MPILPTSSSNQRAQSLQEIFARAIPNNLANVPDSESRLEEKSLESEQAIATVQSIKQDTGERKKYAHRTFCLLCAWLTVIAAIILGQEFHFRGFALDASIILALIGGTTISVIGIFIAVAQYLFPKPKRDRVQILAFLPRSEP